MLKQSKFKEFNLDRVLTPYELENFDEFMKITNHDINAKDVSLTEYVEETLKEINQE